MKRKFTEWLQGKIKNKKFMEQLVPVKPPPPRRPEIPRQGDANILTPDPDVMQAYKDYFERYSKDFLLNKIVITLRGTSPYQTEPIITRTIPPNYIDIYTYFKDRGFHILFNKKPKDGDGRPEIFVVDVIKKLPPEKIIAKYGKYPIKIEDDSSTAFYIAIMDLHETLFGGGITWSEVIGAKPFYIMSKEQFNRPLTTKDIYKSDRYLDLDNPRDKKIYDQIIARGKVIIMPGRPSRP